MVDELVLAVPGRVDVAHLFDPSGQALDTNTTDECLQNLPTFPDSDLYLHGTWPAGHVHSSYTEPQTWNEPFGSSTARTQEPQATIGYYCSAENDSLLTNHIPDSNTRLLTSQLTPGETNDQTADYRENKHERLYRKCVAPSMSKSHSQNGSIGEEASLRMQKHSASEKRYRSSLNSHFLSLKEVLTDEYSREDKGMSSSIRQAKKATRTKILVEAREEILALRKQIRVLEEKSESLRQLAFPATRKFTSRKF